MDDLVPAAFDGLRLAPPLPKEKLKVSIVSIRFSKYLGGDMLPP
jgi:hypothetical protein